MSTSFLDDGFWSPLHDLNNTRFLAAEAVVHLPSEGASYLTCFGMSLLAGLSTTLGALIVFLLPGHRVSPPTMAFVLALAGGVMLSVTVLEFWMPMIAGGTSIGPVLLYSALGAASFLLLSKLVPEPKVTEDCIESHGAAGSLDEESESVIPPPDTMGARSTPDSSSKTDPRKAAAKYDACSTKSDTIDSEAKQHHWRLAMILMLSLTAHNFPEGFAVSISALQNNRLGLVVMCAIAVHNVPEGIAIAVPVLQATGSRSKALWMAFLSGMAEPVGALSALALVHMAGDVIGPESMDNLLCTVGGVMCAVALKELLPEAWRQGEPFAATVGVVSGFAIMWLTRQLGA